MGWLTDLFKPLPAPAPVDWNVKSPWADPGHLHRVIAADIFGVTHPDGLPLTRAAALQVPSVARARHLLVGTISNLPLRVLDVTGPLVDQPRWLSRTDGEPPQIRLAKTIDDLLFHGWSAWAVSRGHAGEVLQAARIPYEWWRFDDDGHVVMEDRRGADVLTADRSVVLIEGLHEGILTFGSRVIAQAGRLEQIAEGRARSPIPVAALQNTDPDMPLTKAEAEDLVAEYVKARRSNDGAVVYLPNGLELKTYGSSDASDLLIAARNQAAVDVARLCGVPASLIDASLSTASLTYQTAELRNREFLDYAVSQYLTPVEARLSADDVVPRGQRVRFDLEQFSTLNPTPTGAEADD